MTINYVEKGYGMHLAIQKAGYSLKQLNGAWVANNDAAVQAIINAYDPLPDYKQAKIASIKSIGLGKIQAVFPAITDFDVLLLVREQYLSVAPAARSPTASMTTAINTYTAATTAITQVNAASTTAQVDAVVVAWP